MPQFTAPLSINDSTPAAVTYSPELLSSSQSVLVDRREASREMQPSMTISFDRPTNTRKTFKVKHSFAYPVIQTVGGVSVVTDIARANVEYILPQSATLAIRENLRAMVANTEDNASIVAGIVNLDPLY